MKVTQVVYISDDQTIYYVLDILFQLLKTMKSIKALKKETNKKKKNKTVN